MYKNFPVVAQVSQQKPRQSGMAWLPSTAIAVIAAVCSSLRLGEPATTHRPSGDTARTSKTCWEDILRRLVPSAFMRQRKFAPPSIARKTRSPSGRKCGESSFSVEEIRVGEERWLVGASHRLEWPFWSFRVKATSFSSRETV